MASFVLIHIPAGEAEVQVGDGKIGIELDGEFVVWDGRAVVPGHMQHPALRVGFERFERGCRGLFERHVVFLDRAERFANLLAEFGRGLI